MKTKRHLCYNTNAKDGTTMKRLMYMMIFIITIFTLTGCQNGQVEDKIPPYFSGLTDINYQVGHDIPELLEGVIALDQVDGNISSNIIVDDSQVDWTKSGSYPLFYTVKDQAGNETTASVLVVITALPVLDTTGPIFSGLKNITYTIGDSLPNLLYGITATDLVDGNVTNSITADDTAVDYTLPGVYEITYIAHDSKDNQTTSVIQITVSEPVEPIEDEEITIFYINDTHGAIEASGNQLGLSVIGNTILNEKSINPDNTLFIGGGDLLQGNILSNYYFGSSMIDIFNVMQMDAFVLGNHEFDWGLEQVLRYQDPTSGQIQADFPFLGANILRKDTMERPDYVDAYTIVQKGALKIGIIGLIGYGLEDSIATARVSPYVFDNPTYWASFYAKYLRTEENVDIVLAVIHGSSDGTNQEIAGLSGNSHVDAIFNGHSHDRYTQIIRRNGVDIPVIQSKSKGEYVGKVTLTIAGTEVKSFNAVNLHPSYSSNDADDHIEADNRLYEDNETINQLIYEYKLAIKDLYSQELITSGESYSSRQLTDYMAEIIRQSVQADVGIHNYGGTTASLSQGQAITIATLYQIFPFDNRVKYVYITGSEISDYANTQVALRFRPGLSLSSLSDNTYYKVATNDYIFDKVEYPFIYGVDPVDTGILIRDLLETVLRNQAEVYPTFRIDQPIALTPVLFDSKRQYIIL